MKTNPQFNEKWLQDQIANDPSILNLGEIFLKDLERRQPSGGRLDMLFEDTEGSTRYEVELQLGATDETHIIRTIEYWDVERKRYPNYEHVAVIVAEDITTRFFNVISLFNSQIPVIAIQISALEVAGNITLHATTVLDLMQRPDDDEVETEQADRKYWETRTSTTSMKTVDSLVSIAKQFDPKIELTYKVAYCGLARNGLSDNYLIFKPRKNHVGFQIRLPRSDDMTLRIEESNMTLLGYKSKWGRYLLQLKEEDLVKEEALITDLVKQSKEYSGKEN
jgi:hypothetical protein